MNIMHPIWNSRASIKCKAFKVVYMERRLICERVEMSAGSTASDTYDNGRSVGFGEDIVYDA